MWSMGHATQEQFRLLSPVRTGSITPLATKQKRGGGRNNEKNVPAARVGVQDLFRRPLGLLQLHETYVKVRLNRNPTSASSDQKAFSWFPLIYD